MQVSREAKPSGGCFVCRAHPTHPFSCLTAGETAIPEQARVSHHYKRGQALFYEGNPPLAVYCIKFGSVRLSRLNRRGDEIVIGRRTAGELVGFRAAIANRPYGLTAVTTEPSQICAIPRDAFLELVGQSPPLALELLRLLAIRSRMTEDQLVSRAHEPVVARTVRLLLATHGVNGAEVKNRAAAVAGLTREEMALLIGTTRETLSRTLHDLAKRGLLEVSPMQVRVLDTEALRASLGT
ncbi:MAG: Crp/Fnr family transcriptional regulator [Candidatus Eisenbacteria bacterium]